MVFALIVAVIWIAACNIGAYLLNENSVLKRFWAKTSRTTFFTTNRSSAVHSLARPETFFAWDLHDATHLVQAWFSPGIAGTCVVLLWRILACAYFALTLVLIEFNGAGLDAFFLPYFTNWTFILLVASELLGAALCVRQLARREPEGPREYGAADKAFALLLITTSACAVFLTMFYWVVLYPTSTSRHYADNALRHGGNVAVLWADYFLSRTPVCSYWIQPVFLYTTIYAVFMWIYHGASSTWLYTALDYWNASAAFYYVLIPLLAYLGFTLTYLVAGCREFLCRRKCCCMCCPSCCCACCGNACREDWDLEGDAPSKVFVPAQFRQTELSAPPQVPAQ